MEMGKLKPIPTKTIEEFEKKEVKEIELLDENMPNDYTYYDECEKIAIKKINELTKAVNQLRRELDER
jgi:hypothetical protein